jgi:tRNA(Ile2) C34 agmatinyltransferase TiaS
MGGYGSGQWYRSNSKATIESQSKIDIRLLNKLGLLHQGIELDFSKASRGEKCGLAGFRVETDRLVLLYRNRQINGQWEQSEDKIFFSWTPCNHGGNRQWFLCPGCNRRVAAIYSGEYYRCRHCHNLTYSSQQESKSDRLLRKARKIRTRLGASGNLAEPIFFKPKNMHQKTFDRLRREADDAINRYAMVMGERMGILD